MASPADKFRAPRRIKVNLAAGAEKTYPASGRFFYISEANHSEFEVGLDLGDFLALDQARGHECVPGDDDFEQIRVKNNGDVALVMQIEFGHTRPIDNRLNLVRDSLLKSGNYLPVMEGRTRVVANATTSLDQDEEIELTGESPTATDYKRQSVLVTNLDQNLNLDIVDLAGNIVAVVFASKQIILPISEYVVIRNPHASTIALYVAEIWITGVPVQA